MVIVVSLQTIQLLCKPQAFANSQTSCQNVTNTWAVDTARNILDLAIQVLLQTTVQSTLIAYCAKQ